MSRIGTHGFVRRIEYLDLLGSSRDSILESVVCDERSCRTATDAKVSLDQARDNKRVAIRRGAQEQYRALARAPRAHTGDVLRVSFRAASGLLHGDSRTGVALQPVVDCELRVRNYQRVLRVPSRPAFHCVCDNYVTGYVCEALDRHRKYGGCLQRSEQSKHSKQNANSFHGCTSKPPVN